MLKLEYLEWKIIYLWNKNILNLHLRWHRSYCFVAGVTFNCSNYISVPLFKVSIRGTEHVTTFKTSLLTVNSTVNPSIKLSAFNLQVDIPTWLEKWFTVYWFTDYCKMHFATPNLIPSDHESLHVFPLINFFQKSPQWKVFLFFFIYIYILYIYIYI